MGSAFARQRKRQSPPQPQQASHRRCAVKACGKGVDCIGNCMITSKFCEAEIALARLWPHSSNSRRTDPSSRACVGFRIRTITSFRYMFGVDDCSHRVSQTVTRFAARPAATLCLHQAQPSSPFSPQLRARSLDLPSQNVASDCAQRGQELHRARHSQRKAHVCDLADVSAAQARHVAVSSVRE